MELRDKDRLNKVQGRGRIFARENAAQFSRYHRHLGGTGVGASGVMIAAIIMLGEYVDDGLDPLTRVK